MYGVKLTYVYFQINSNMIQIRPTMLNEQQIKRIKELSSTKLLPTDIAHQMNISLGTVYKYRNRENTDNRSGS